MIIVETFRHCKLLFFSIHVKRKKIFPFFFIAAVLCPNHQLYNPVSARPLRTAEKVRWRLYTADSINLHFKMLKNW